MVILGKSYYLKITFSSFVWLFYTKIITTGYRIADLLRDLPLRVNRLLKHFVDGAKNLSYHISTAYSLRQLFAKVGYWWLESIIHILNILGVAELYETVNDFVKFNSRSLTNWEKRLAKSVFGDSLNYSRIRIDNLALLGPRQYRLSYVSFFTVNTWGDMPNHILIHELVHVWQYQKMGAVYIPRALYAQTTEAGYNYGGLCALKDAIENGKGLNAFNIEQQAEIITDYYRVREGYKAQWSPNANFLDLPTFEHFVEELKA